MYATVPPSFYQAGGRQILLNRGEFDSGTRLAADLSYRLTPELELQAFGGRLLDSAPSKRWIAQIGMSYQFAGLVNRLLR